MYQWIRELIAAILYRRKFIAIAGMNRAGKSALSYYLAEKQKPSKTDSSATESINKLKGIEKIDGKNKMTIFNFRHHEKKYSDYKREKDYIKKSDIIFYLIDLNEIISNVEYYEYFINEIELFSKLCKDNNKPLLLVATHLDKINGFNNQSLDSNKELIEDIKQKKIFKNILLHLSKNNMNEEDISYVALTDKYIEESANKILERVIKYIK